MKTKKDGVKELLNFKTLGGYLRQFRKNYGYKNAAELAKALGEKAGYYVSDDTVSRIERGKTEPTISYICALGMVTSRELVPSVLDSFLFEAACPRWQAIFASEKENRAPEKLTARFAEELFSLGVIGSEDCKGEIITSEKFINVLDQANLHPEDFSYPNLREALKEHQCKSDIKND